MSCFGVAALIVQAQKASVASFEVASVRLSDPQSDKAIGIATYPGGKVVCNFCSLSYLIENAYDVRGFQIEGISNWMPKDKFDVVGIPSESSSARKLNPASPKVAPNQEQRDMLKTLLVERFGLKARIEQRQSAVLWLMKADKQLKRRKTERKCHT